MLEISTYLKPDTWFGAVAYLLFFVLAAVFLSRALRAAVHAAMTRKGSIDRTTISFLQQIGTALIWVLLLILYAHLIPVLRSMGNALFAGASVASVVIGLAAQSTLGNLVAGVSITIYRPFRLGDTLQVAAPTGTEIGVVELMSLGYTSLRAADGHLIVLPNSIAASQVTINLNSTFSPGAVAVTIRVSRTADVAAARELSMKVAAENVGEKSVIGCYLTKIDGSGATLELRLQAPSAAERDIVRSKLLSQLAKRFNEHSDVGPAGADSVAFS